MYKHKMDKLPITVSNLFSTNSTVHTHNTRQMHKYHVIAAKTNKTKFGIKYRGPSIWNKLPDELLCIHNIKLFKRKCKQFVLFNDFK